MLVVLYEDGVAPGDDNNSACVPEKQEEEDAGCDAFEEHTDVDPRLRWRTCRACRRARTCCAKAEGGPAIRALPIDMSDMSKIWKK